MKGAIIYKGKYGATLDYAAMLGKELSLPVFTGTCTANQAAGFDYLLIGSAVYIGHLSLKEWLVQNEPWLKDKKLFFFIVCGTPAEDREKTARIVADNIPPGLRSNDIFFLRGRMIRSRLSWTDRLLLRLGAWLNRNPQQKKNMLQDFDEVHISRLRPLFQALKAWDFNERQRKLREVY